MTKKQSYEWYPSPRYLLRRKLIIRNLRTIDCRNKSILEIGYGAGDTLCSYAALGMKVYGYDFSKIAKKEASRRLKVNGYTNVTLWNTEDEAYAKTRQYDVVAACEVLEHIEDDENMLQRWHDLIQRDGYIIITVPSRMKKWCLNDVWAGHYRRYEKQELRDKLLAAGFEIVNFWSYPFPINIALDYFLEKEKKREKGIELHDEKGFKKEDMTKESGVKREASALARMFSKDWLLLPWHLLQLLFVNTDLGSGYVVMAKKVDVYRKN